MPKRVRLQTRSAAREDLPDLQCACATTRRAARLITAFYGEYLRKQNLEVSQIVLLSAVMNHPGRSQTALAAALGFDKTTLSRNLKLLQKKKLIEIKIDEVTNERGVFLTARGVVSAKSAAAGRTKAQGALKALMSDSEWKAMWKGLRALTRAAQRVEVA